VTDNAANMLAAVPKHTKKIDVGLACFDHLLRTSRMPSRTASPSQPESTILHLTIRGSEGSVIS